MKPAGLILASAVLPLSLGGCVAAAIPVIAGSMVAKTRMDGKPDGDPKVEHRREKRQVETAKAPATPAPSAREKQREERRAVRRERQAARDTAPAPKAAEPTPSRLRPVAEGDIPKLARADIGQPQILTGLTALPPPVSGPGAVGAPFPAFVHYALTAAQPEPGRSFRSALVDPATLTAQPARPDCGTQPPAVVIDLDPGKAAFDLDDPPAAAPGLAERLAALRAAGLTILWQASLPAEQSERLYATLAATGLDIDRTDRLLLIRKAGERKQARRQAAARDWCILAIAGDSKGDFEEAFDYLRDPNGTIAAALNANLGDGWFLVPQPID